MNLVDHLLRAKNLDLYPRPEQKRILANLAFAFYIRKGVVPSWVVTLRKFAEIAPPDFKFNPYHDERGRFTYGPDGPADDKPDDNGGESSAHSVIDQVGLFLQHVFGVTPAYAQEADEEESGREEEGDDLAEARTEAFNSALSRLRDIDPNNRQLSSITGPDWVPTWNDVAQINQEIANVRNAQIADMLAPGGDPIGDSGTRPYTRELPGGEPAAEDMFQKLIQGATPDALTSYSGTAYRLPDGGFIGYRSMSSDGETPTIDVNITPLTDIIRKLKFVEGDAQ